MKYSQIRDKYQSKNFIMLADNYAYKISPLITKLLLKTNLTPNNVTVLMMISGIIGSILFCIPNLVIKMVGIVFIHLWYVLDCSDGELARIKKKYSLFGKEIDYAAHILNHPLFTLSFLIASVQLHYSNNFRLAIFFMIIIIANLVFRNVLLFNGVYADKMEINKKENLEINCKISLKNKIINNLTLFPNFALLFPVLYIIDIILKTKLGYIYIIIFMLTSVFINYIKLIRWILKVVNK